MTTVTMIDNENAFMEIKDEVLHIIIKPNTVVDLEDMHENISLRKELQQGKEMLVLLDIRNLADISSEAKEYGAQDDVAGMNIAMAVLAQSLATKLIGNFFIKLNKPTTPTKLFKSKEKALEWLKQYR